MRHVSAWNLSRAREAALMFVLVCPEKPRNCGVKGSASLGERHSFDRGEERKAPDLPGLSPKPLSQVITQCVTYATPYHQRHRRRRK